MSLCQEQERVFLNRFGQTIYEDILHFTLGSHYPLDKEKLVEKGRAIGTNVLQKAIERVPLDRHQYLSHAINLASQVEPSPIFNPITAKTDF